MNTTPENLALEQAVATCDAHEEALQDALSDLAQRNVAAQDLLCLGKEDRRLLDQFAYRYTRLQDDMGARLIPAILIALGEAIAAMPAIDRLNRLEQLLWLPSADEWSDLRRIRNEFTHDYPETPQERYEKLQLAIASAHRLIGILGVFKKKLGERSREVATESKTHLAHPSN
ncbi:MAG: hypothetical protein ABW166_14565 [Sedimenticola sp.]